MRHARRDVRLSRTSEHRHATLANLTKALIRYGQIRTTLIKAKQTQRVADRLVSLGKDGSVHSRRQAYRLLQDRGLVKQLFAEVAPLFSSVQGGYTRVLKLAPRTGDGAQQALLEFTQRPVAAPKAPAKAKADAVATARPVPSTAKPEREEETSKKPKRFFEGLRDLFHKPKQGSGPA